jgi:hypothetical protein
LRRALQFSIAVAGTTPSLLWLANRLGSVVCHTSLDDARVSISSAHQHLGTSLAYGSLAAWNHRWQEGLAVGEKAIAERVEALEKGMDSLRGLPAKFDDLGTRVSGVESRLTTVESQVVQLRRDMNDGFSATLQIIEASSKATQTMFDATQKIIRQGDEETRIQMRVLHEDLVKRLAVLGEGRPHRGKRS